MFTTIRRAINTTSVKLTTCVAAGLVGGTLIASTASAQDPLALPRPITPEVCKNFQNEQVVMFVINQNGKVHDFFGGPGKPKSGYGVKQTLLESEAINVIIGNPGEYCYKKHGQQICILY